MTPTEHPIAVNDIYLLVYEWGERLPDKPALIFFHATGFHARCWDEVIRQLSDFRCYAVDACGHGRSAKPPPPRSWQQYGQDATDLVRALGLQNAIGIGHSMGGNSVVRAAAAVPEAFQSLLLVDPVIMTEDWYAHDTYSIEGHFILNRRRHWSSSDEMVASFKGRGPFIHWNDAVLRDYCEHAILPDADGDGYVLACAPEVEAHIYSSTSSKSGMDVYDAVARIQVPVRVLRCANTVDEVGFDLMASPTAPDLASRFQNGIDFPLADNSHFIPMESPDIVARHIRELAALRADH